MYAQSPHAGDSQPVTRAARADVRAGRSVTQASGVRVASQYDTHDHAHDSDGAPNYDRQASVAQSHRRLSVCV